MTAANFDACLAFTLAQEGGFANNSADPGGPTNMGITSTTLANWLGRPVSLTDVQGLTQATAAQIYRARYWSAVNGDSLPVGIDLMLFDWAVNAGPVSAVMRTQKLVHVQTDGIVGPQTLEAISSHDPRWLIALMGAARAAFYEGLNEPQFLPGWLNRNNACCSAALAMLTA